MPSKMTHQEFYNTLTEVFMLGFISGETGKNEDTIPVPDEYMVLARHKMLELTKYVVQHDAVEMGVD